MSSSQITSPLQHHGRIDMVALDKATNTAVLSLTETREWSVQNGNLYDLQEKLNSYIAYVEEGQMLRDYPATAGKQIELRLHTVHALSAEAKEFISSVQRDVLSKRGIKLTTHSLPRN